MNRNSELILDKFDTNIIKIESSRTNIRDHILTIIKSLTTYFKYTNVSLSQ